jgi:hypothetical protein
MLRCTFQTRKSMQRLDWQTKIENTQKEQGKWEF